MTPHKHAEILRAIADGKDVQCMYVNETNAEWHGNWLWNMLGDPRCIWRIKPQEKKPVKRWLWAFKELDQWFSSLVFFTEQEAATNYKHLTYKKLPWSETEFEE